jgi:primosomal protein N' (replication factor Y)
MKYAQVVVNTPLAVRVTKEKEELGVSESSGEEEFVPAESLEDQDAHAKPLPEDIQTDLPDEEVEQTDSPYERIFTYSIPEQFVGQVARGQLVWVPFGKRRLQGVIVAFSDTSPVQQTKDIEEIVDSRPFLSQVHLDLAHWIAHTYLCTYNSAIQMMLPIGIAQQTDVLLSLVPEMSRENLTEKQSALVALLARDGETKLRALPRELHAAIDPLVRRGIVVKRSMVMPAKAKPKRVQFVRLIADDALLGPMLEKASRRNLQADVLEYLAQHRDIPLPTGKICEAVGCSKSTLNTLAEKNWIDVFQSQTLISLTPKYFVDLASLSETQSRVLVYLREHGTKSAEELKSAEISTSDILGSLARKGYIQRERVESTVTLRLPPNDVAETVRKLRRTKERYAAIVDFLRGENKSVWISALYASVDCELEDLQKLADAGVVSLEEEEVWRDSLAGRAFEIAEPPKLTPEQERVWSEISSKFKVQSSKSANLEPRTLNLEPETLQPETFLLHGVTGSGKTEIYMRALAEIIAQGKQGIVLVPEISLTPQTIRRFGARFKRIAVVHSQLSIGERYDTWRRCRDGLVDVVIGARSALFAPLPNLGLIALDEEHDPSYKQAEVPRYHAREVALELAQHTGAIVILGDATPDVETYYRATRDEFKLLELPKRVMGHRAVIENQVSEFGIQNSELALQELDSGNTDARYLELPPVEIVDLRAELKAGNRSMFSRALQREMTRVLAAREQVILFLNRRGTATFILCRDCGRVFNCRRCDNPMTYHGGGDQLICHHCNRRDRVPTKCPQCASVRIRYFGIGTEKVEAEIQAMFPKARTLRWDWDVTHGKESHEAILEKFTMRQADILIGTQMIAKGLDLPFVTLVGVISADTSLNLPDFRAGERTFQLLTQVAGRAGRSILGGKVIVQTYNPEHYAIVAASSHDYRAFYEREIAFRREQGYPPFNRLVRLLYSHGNAKRAQDESARLYRMLAARIAQRGIPALDLIGPAPSFFQRVRGEYRQQIILRGEHPHTLVTDLALPLGWRVDVDPVSVL